jgi:hypothetical protein
MSELTQTELQKLLSYDAQTGDLIWRHRPREMFCEGYNGGETSWKTWNSRYAGKLASNVGSGGYVRVNIMGKRYFAHRLIWMMVHGEWPEEIDHINGNRTDNRLCNLRAVNRQENLRNVARRSDNSSGVTGVSYSKRDGVFIAYINVSGVMKVLGRFETLEKAAAARSDAEKQYGFHANHGRAA